MNVSFIGLGKLGLPLACCLAESGNKILGVDKNEYVLDKLNHQELPFYEPGLNDIFPHPNFIGFTDSYKRAVEETDASIILVNTQLGDSGYSDEFVESALTDLAVNLKRSDKDYHLIVLSSGHLHFLQLIQLMDCDTLRLLLTVLLLTIFLILLFLNLE